MSRANSRPLSCRKEERGEVPGADVVARAFRQRFAEHELPRATKGKTKSREGDISFHGFELKTQETQKIIVVPAHLLGVVQFQTGFSSLAESSQCRPHHWSSRSRLQDNQRNKLTFTSLRNSFSWFWKHFAAACCSFVLLIIFVVACGLLKCQIRRLLEASSPTEHSAADPIGSSHSAFVSGECWQPRLSPEAFIHRELLKHPKKASFVTSV